MSDSARDQVALNVRLGRDVHRLAKIRAASEGRSLRSIVQDLMAGYVGAVPPARGLPPATAQPQAQGGRAER